MGWRTQWGPGSNAGRDGSSYFPGEFSRHTRSARPGEKGAIGTCGSPQACLTPERAYREFGLRLALRKLGNQRVAVTLGVHTWGLAMGTEVWPSFESCLARLQAWSGRVYHDFMRFAGSSLRISGKHLLKL